MANRISSESTTADLGLNVDALDAFGDAIRTGWLSLRCLCTESTPAPPQAVAVAAADEPGQA